ncbi:Kinesin-like protein [Diplonema papillatum]|nr:Kinesin-like protein [Diplonema papillatum]
MSTITVAIRKRPLSRVEREKGGVDIVDMERSNLAVHEPKVKFDLTKYTENHNYVFDRCFNEREDNETVYLDVVRPLLDVFFAGGNATCFAYGQTGSGKTHTMLGKKEDKGVYLLAADDIFTGTKGKEIDVFVSFYEIYGRKLFDLLNDRAKMVAREDADKNVNIVGLTEHEVNSVGDLMSLMSTGSANRSAGATSANADSSRSHAVLRIEMKSSSSKSLGVLSFIDLAGNERGSDTANADRQTRVEGAEINKSLLALKECIRALGTHKSHIPFRGSILTEVLRDSFLGNSRTTMIANISPSSTNCEHSLNTLRYTHRVKELKQEKKPRRPVAGRRAEQKRDLMPAKQKKIGEDVMQIVRSLRPEICAANAEVVNVDDDEEDEEDKEIEAAYTHVATALSQAQEDLVVHYRSMLDDRVQIMLKETEAIKSLDQGGVRNLDEFVSSIDSCLFLSIQSINEMRDRLAVLKEHLRREEVLGQSFCPTFRA